MLCKAIEEWAAEAGVCEQNSPIARSFDFGDWKIELTLFRGLKAEAHSNRAIGGSIGDVRFVDAILEIRKALRAKGQRYGELSAPYLIVVADCKDELTGGESNDEELVDALFGSVTYPISVRGPEPRVGRPRRSVDGYWGHPMTPRNTNVSGMILMPRAHLWSLRDSNWQPLRVLNPWANHPLSSRLLPLPGHALNIGNKFEILGGTSFADILRLPEKWPPT